MRQKPNINDKKLSSVVKSRVSGLNVDRTSTATRKRAKIPWSRRAKCQTRIKGYLMQPKKRNKRSAGQISVAKRMAQLHLPFVDSKRHLRSDAEILNKLRWSTVDVPRDHRTAWEDAHHLCHEALPSSASDTGPHWSVPPRESISSHCQICDAFVVGMEEEPEPANSQGLVFSSVDWEQNAVLKLGASRQREEGKRTKAINWMWNLKLRSIQHPRIRTQWKLLEGMVPSSFQWKPQTTDRAKRRDAHRHTGFLDYNQRSQDKDLWPQTALSAFLSPLRSETEYFVERVRPTVLSEVYEASEVGRLVMSVVATDAFPSQWLVFSYSYVNCLNNFSGVKHLFGPSFSHVESRLRSLNTRARPNALLLHGGKNIRPLLFAAHDKGDCTRNAIEQLALAFQPMMTLFILYYLDTRASREEPMPDWMVLFGTVYDENGIELLAFYPSFRLPKFEPPGTVGDWGWGSSAYSISRAHTQVMRRPVWQRGSLLAKLCRIQGHCQHVLEHLRRWERLPSAVPLG